MSTVIDYMDPGKKWRWGYFEPRFFKIVNDRIVAVASSCRLASGMRKYVCFLSVHGRKEL